MNHRTPLGLVTGLVFLALFILVLGPSVTGQQTSPQAAMTVGEALWHGRTFEVILQGIMILSGVMSIILLIGPGRSRKRLP